MKEIEMKQKGFTLIELVVVIVILGILAATAVPRFVDMAGDARAASRNGLEGAVRSAANLAYGAAAARGQAGATGTISMGGNNVSLVFGYPRSNATGGIDNALTSQGSMTPAFAAGVATWTISGGTNCTVTYQEPAAAGGGPTVGGGQSC